MRPRASHAVPRAKSVIMLMQNGGPSQMELFDPKPELNRREGEVYSTKVEMFQTGRALSGISESAGFFWSRPETMGAPPPQSMPSAGSSQRTPFSSLLS